jgi:hypothetical protein
MTKLPTKAEIKAGWAKAIDRTNGVSKTAADHGDKKSVSSKSEGWSRAVAACNRRRGLK